MGVFMFALLFMLPLLAGAFMISGTESNEDIDTEAPEPNSPEPDVFLTDTHDPTAPVADIKDTDCDDTITGDDEGNIIAGHAGDDILIGGEGEGNFEISVRPTTVTGHVVLEQQAS